jgi:hypothetical protein
LIASGGAGACFRDRLGADIQCAARPILDDDRLAPASRELDGDDPRQDIGGTATRNRHDDLDHAARVVVLRQSPGWCSGKKHRTDELVHDFPVHDGLPRLVAGPLARLRWRQWCGLDARVS